MLNADHDHGLDKISVYRIAHPSPAGFNLKTAAPFGMKRINLVSESRDTILTEKNWAFNLVLSLLSRLYLESQLNQIRF